MVTLPNKVRASVDELIRQLNANNFNIGKAYIFGSYAKGRQTEWSDIDVALVSDQFEGNRFYDHCKISPYLIKVDTSLEVHPFSPEDFTKTIPSSKRLLKRAFELSEFSSFATTHAAGDASFRQPQRFFQPEIFSLPFAATP